MPSVSAAVSLDRHTPPALSGPRAGHRPPLASLVVDLRKHIRAVPDFPQDGVMFRDITPLLGDPSAFRHTIEQLCGHAAARQASAIAGIESRGFLFGAAMADRMGLPFVPLRKAGKLPAARWSVRYSLEYGHSRLEIHRDALSSAKRAYLVDDLLATGGTAEAAARLIEMAGGQVAGVGFVIELVKLAGRSRIAAYDILSLLRY